MAFSISPDIQKIIEGAALRHGVDPLTMKMIAQLESGGNPNAKNSKSTAGGLYQFIDSTAAQYKLADKLNPSQSSDAGARLTRDNRNYLTRVLGREPTREELYLAHQQGAGGASKLLRSDPNALAASVVGEKAVTLNGGRPDMTVGEFANLWLKKAAKLVSGAEGEPEQAQTASTEPATRQSDFEEIVRRALSEMGQPKNKMTQIGEVLSSLSRPKEDSISEMSKLFKKGIF